MYAAFVGFMIGIVEFFKREKKYGEKVDRYNNTIFELKKVALWYETLNEIEKKIPANFSKMVTDTEEIICREFLTRFNSTKSSLEIFIENKDETNIIVIW